MSTKLTQRLASSPLLARVAPFGAFVLLTSLQALFGGVFAYWAYFGKIVLGAWILWLVRPYVAEMRWNLSWEAVVAGIGVFVMWVGIDGLYPPLPRTGGEWAPLKQFGPVLGWFFVVVRIAGATLVVPLVEEVFYRSFLYRYIAKPDFLSLPIGYFAWMPFVATSVVFGFAHFEWLAGILCGFAYQWLVCRKKRLGDAIMAHAITNFLLGLWVVWKGAWNFW